MVGKYKIYMWPMFVWFDTLTAWLDVKILTKDEMSRAERFQEIV